MPRALNLRYLLALTLAGCSVTASLGGDAEQQSTGVQTGETTSATSTSAETTSGEGTGVGTVTADAGTTSDTGQGTESGSGVTTAVTVSSSGGSGDDTTGSEPLVCQGPSDASCLSCLRDSCCSALEQCLTTPLCACLLGCLEFAPDFVSCLDIPACDGGPAAGELQTCASSGCTTACGL